MASKKFSRLSVLLEARDKMSGPFQNAAKNAQNLSKNVNSLSNKVGQNNQKFNTFNKTLKAMNAPIKSVNASLGKMGQAMSKAIGNTTMGMVIKQSKTFKTLSGAVDKAKNSIKDFSMKASLSNSKLGQFIQKVKQANAEMNKTGNRGRATFNQLVQSNQKLNQQLERMNRQIAKGNRGLSTMRTNIGSINAMGAAFTALYTGQAVAQGASNATGATVGKAMEQQYSQVSVGLIAGDEKKGAEYWRQIQEYAAQTTYSAEDWARSMRGAISKSSNVKDLEQYQIVLEQLATLDPIQGLDGAALAVRELNSGDAVSLVERFELPRKVLNDIKNIKDPIKQIQELSKVIGEQTGYTVDAIQGMKELPLMQWEKFKNTVSTVAGYIGTGALGVISPLLEQVNQMYSDGAFDGFIKLATDGFKNLVENVVNFATTIYNAFESGAIQERMAPFLNLFENVRATWSEAWPTVKGILENAGTILGEVADGISSVWPAVNDTLQTALDLVEDFSDWVVNNWEGLGPIIGGVVGALAGMKIATSIAAAVNILRVAIGLWRNGTLLMTAAQWGLNIALNMNPIGIVVTLLGILVGALIGAWMSSETFRDKVKAVWSWMKGAAGGAFGYVKTAIGWAVDAFKSAVNWVDNFKERLRGAIDYAKSIKINWSAILPGGKKFITAGGSGGGGGQRVGGAQSHHGGLSNVPYNGYGANLHKGERVLTAMENKAYTQSLYGGGKGGVTVSGNTFIVRKDEDIDAIASALYNKMAEAVV